MRNYAIEINELNKLINQTEFVYNFISKDVKEYLNKLKQKRAKLEEKKILEGIH